jgi:hypothetical protein
MNPAHDLTTHSFEQKRGRQKSPGGGPSFFWCAVNPSRGKCGDGSRPAHERSISARAFSSAVFALTGPPGDVWSFRWPLVGSGGEAAATSEKSPGGGGMGGGAGGDARFVSRASIPLGSGGKPSNPLGDIPASNEEKSAKSPGPNAGGIGAWCGGAEDVEAEENARGGGTSVSRLPPLPPAAAARASRRSRAFRAAARASAASARERSTAAWRARSSSLIADARSSTDAGDGAAAASVSVFVSPAFNTLSSDALGISAAPKSSGNAPPANESPLAPLAPLSTRGMLGTLGMFAVPDPPTTSSKKFGGGSAKGGADGSDCACRAGAGAGADARTGKNGFLM